MGEVPSEEKEMKKTRAELMAEKFEQLMKLMDGASTEQLERWSVALQDPVVVYTTPYTSIPKYDPMTTTYNPHGGNYTVWG